MKRILVIGGSGYVGQSIVQELLKNSETQVLWTYYQHPVVLENKNQRSFFCDITSSESILALYKSVLNEGDTLDGLVFCAAYPLHAIYDSKRSAEPINYSRSWESSKEDDELLRFYSLHLINAVRPFLNILKKGQNPNVVFLGSLVGLKSVPAPLSLSMAKASLRGVVESLAKDLGEFGIKVNSVDPGILAGGQAEFLTPKIKQDYLKHTSLKRFGTSEEISKVVSWFLLHNTFITSRAILLDGGL